ncbi:hypothetical protein CEXT_514901 [Caerostris extrusa]|uniref:Uncharacterized protein n=1 Tax=Caerostris extrusa TaxID=172846 RepID=A0AAV4SKS1_CAEEX|nr:hypothetical protein CEXT_514901 [Caerostris extrusa]
MIRTRGVQRKLPPPTDLGGDLLTTAGTGTCPQINTRQVDDGALRSSPTLSPQACLFRFAFVSQSSRLAAFFHHKLTALLLTVKSLWRSDAPERLSLFRSMVIQRDQVIWSEFG